MKKACFFVVCAILFFEGCATTSTAPPPHAVVTVTPSTASVPPGLTAQFTATINNSSGLIWSVSCSVAQCGSVSPAATASGAPTTYTAPSTLAANLTVTVTAASATDSTVTSSASIAVPALSVSISPASATILLKGTQAFTATVANDSSNKGINWTLTQGGTSCSPGCGTITPATTSSASPATYTAPASMPATSNVTVVATSAADSNISAPAAITIMAPHTGVTVTPSTATVPPGLTAQFTATSSNSSGVIWSVSCSVAQCGSVSPSATASGLPTTYTAPSTLTNLTVTITAASATDSTVTSSASIAVPALSVSISPASATILLKGTQAFTATVANDSSNKGVNWTLTQGGTSCSPGCGTIAPATTSSGSPTTYTAPASMPASSNVTVIATSAADSNISASAAITISQITVSVSPSNASVAVGTTQQFTATVNNDTTNSGAAWTLTQAGKPCSPACGTISPTTTSSGVATVYTAPATVPTAAQVAVTATSLADSTASASASVTIGPAISVSISPASASVFVGATQQFTATVANDLSNKGVNWTLTQGGTICSPGCGTIAPAATSSGSPATYTAPASIPANPNVTVVATSAADSSRSASAAITVIAITVSISPASTSVAAGTTQQFTATVNNDASNKGTAWTLTQAGKPCSPACGTINPTTTSSGFATVYTAPTTAPASAQVTVTATSLANSSASASAIATILGSISVSVSPANSSVLAGATQQFTATIANDAANNGATWSLTQNGANCSPGCGTVSPASTTTGNPITYTAPAGVPAPAGVTLTATSVADSTKSASSAITVTGPCGTGNETLLKGQYAFLLQGFDANNNPVAIGGSFDADGAGHIAQTVGVEDINRASGPQTGLSILSAGSSYSVGSDKRGCLTLANSAGTTTTFRFVLGSVTGTPAVAGKGRILEFDDATGTGTHLAGQIRLQDPASFSNAAFSGPYTFGFYGQDNGQLRFAVAGTFTSDGNGSITGGTFDQDQGGTLTSDTLVSSGSYSVGTDGHGTIGITAIGVTNHFAMYMINSSDAFFVSTDSLSIDPIFSGEAVKSAATFTTSSLNGSAVLHLTCSKDVLLALVAADGLGNLSSFKVFQNNAGTTTSQNITTGTYSVAPNGRVTFTGLGANPPVLYLSGQNTGFAVGTGPFSEIGMLEAQAAGPFSNASFSGTYLFATEIPGSPSVHLEVGAAIAQGSAGTGTGTSDEDDGGGLLIPNQNISFTFSFASDGTGDVGTGTTAILISSSKIVYFENTQSFPRVGVVEQ